MTFQLHDRKNHMVWFKSPKKGNPLRKSRYSVKYNKGRWFCAICYGFVVTIRRGLHNPQSLLCSAAVFFFCFFLSARSRWPLISVYVRSFVRNGSISITWFWLNFILIVTRLLKFVWMFRHPSFKIKSKTIAV